MFQVLRGKIFTISCYTFLICVSWNNKPECLQLIFVQVLNYSWMLCMLWWACQNISILSEKKLLFGSQISDRLGGLDLEFDTQ